ncbi:hypothetical protein [Paracoccus sp. (in: a-proteobacteria)]|uniref:hypothetical protein n=1 Tax=Paracoccus sp. TaxID=267 RepID=UPI00272DA529|nr:hypothetical protein [Paracoccus sp. (in: a-proteobacteria)]
MVLEKLERIAAAGRGRQAEARIAERPGSGFSDERRIERRQDGAGNLVLSLPISSRRGSLMLKFLI